MPRGASKDRIHEHLIKEIHEPAFHTRFSALQRADAAFERYTTASDLLAMLWERSEPNYEEKDRCLSTLIRLFRLDPNLRPTAFTVLFAALWPALEHLFYQSFRWLTGSDDPFSEISWAFLEELEAWNLEKTFKVAINLQLNTQKRVLKKATQDLMYVSLNEASDVAAGSTADHEARENMKRCKAITELLASGVLRPEEQQLLMDHAIHGRSLKEIATEYQLPYKTLCKRFERAVGRVRQILAQRGLS